MPKLIAATLLAIAALTVVALASGATYLEAMLPGGLPLGNALAALGLCAVGGAAVALSAQETALRTMAVASLIAAAAWLPVSIVLAGNLALNFGGERGLAWVILSLGIVVLLLISFIWTLGAALFGIYRRAPCPPQVSVAERARRPAPCRRGASPGTEREQA
jgi:hypothetical protein